ncbi:MAG: hypothetical protein HQ567_06625 [Candidatus Nealsonbacteria bacterium]|nr:hypothetical protein [Candidatus Nealsonbacteria bacterium]
MTATTAPRLTVGGLVVRFNEQTYFRWADSPGQACRGTFAPGAFDSMLGGAGLVNVQFENYPSWRLDPSLANLHLDKCWFRNALAYRLGLFGAVDADCFRQQLQAHRYAGVVPVLAVGGTRYSEDVAFTRNGREPVFRFSSVHLSAITFVRHGSADPTITSYTQSTVPA